MFCLDIVTLNLFLIKVGVQSSKTTLPVQKQNKNKKPTRYTRVEQMSKHFGDNVSQVTHCHERKLQRKGQNKFSKVGFIMDVLW